MPFLATLTAVAAVGVLALAAHQWITEPVRTQTNEIAASRKNELSEQTDSGDDVPPTEADEIQEEEAPSRYGEQLADAAYMEENNIYTTEPPTPVR